MHQWIRIGTYTFNLAHVTHIKEELEAKPPQTVVVFVHGGYARFTGKDRDRCLALISELTAASQAQRAVKHITAQVRTEVDSAE